MRKGSLKLFASNAMAISFAVALVSGAVGIVAGTMVSVGLYATIAMIVGKVATWILLVSGPVFLVSLAIAFTE